MADALGCLLESYSWGTPGSYDWCGILAGQLRLILAKELQLMYMELWFMFAGEL